MTLCTYIQPLWDVAPHLSLLSFTLSNSYSSSSLPPLSLAPTTFPSLQYPPCIITPQNHTLISHEILPLPKTAAISENLTIGHLPLFNTTPIYHYFSCHHKQQSEWTPICSFGLVEKYWRVFICFVSLRRKWRSRKRVVWTKLKWVLQQLELRFRNQLLHTTTHLIGRGDSSPEDPSIGMPTPFISREKLTHALLLYFARRVLLSFSTGPWVRLVHLIDGPTNFQVGSIFPTKGAREYQWIGGFSGLITSFRILDYPLRYTIR